jgi:hypothetical protein
MPTRPYGRFSHPIFEVPAIGFYKALLEDAKHCRSMDGKIITMAEKNVVRAVRQQEHWE